MRELEPSLGRFAFLTRWHSLHLPCGVCNGPFISPDSYHSSRNSTFSKNIFHRAMINMAESLRVHSLIARAALHSRASAVCNFGQTAGPSLIKFGTREGEREGGREGREGRGGEGRGGEGRGGGRGRAGQGRAGQGRGGEGRGGGGEGRGGDCPHFPQTRTFVTAEPSRTPASRVTG